MGRPRPGLSDFSKSILNQAVLEAYLELRTHIQDSWRILQVLEALQFTRQSQQQPARDRAASGRRKSGSKSAREKIFFSREKKYFSRGPRIQVGEKKNIFSRVGDPSRREKNFFLADLGLSSNTKEHRELILLVWVHAPVTANELEGKYPRAGGRESGVDRGWVFNIL